MGLLVMDEVFDGWFKKAAHDYGAHSFATDWKKDVTEWVKRDRNHPAVVIWSIGNETGERDDNGIVKVIETLDRTRGTTGGTVTGGVSIAGINGPSEMPGYQQPVKDLPFVATKPPTLGKLEACTSRRHGTGITFTKEFSRHPISPTQRSFSMTGWRTRVASEASSHRMTMLMSGATLGTIGLSPVTLIGVWVSSAGRDLIT